MQHRVFLPVIIVFLSLLGFVTPAAAQQDSTIDFSNNRHIIDNADVFTPQEEQELAQTFDDLYFRDDVVVAVETLDTLQGNNIRTYATNRHNTLGIGDRDKDNGLFFVLAIEDREYFVTLGDGFDHVSEAELATLLDETLPEAFRSEAYAEGVTLAAQRFAAEDFGHSATFFKIPDWLSPVHFIVVGIIVLSLIFGKRSPVVYPSPRKKQRILQRNANIFEQISKRGIARQFQEAQGLHARAELLRSRDILGKREQYQEYHDRQLIEAHYDIWTYTTGDSIEYMAARQEHYDARRESGNLTPEEFYSILSLEERLDFERGKRRHALLRQKGVKNATPHDYAAIEQRIIGLMAADMMLQKYHEDQRVRTSSRRSGSRSGGSSSGRGAGGSW